MTELITKLGIDWRLLLAQLVNFAVLAFLLRKFLWKPLLAAIAERQTKAQRIEELAKEVSQAQQKMEQRLEEVEHTARQHASQIIQEAEAHAKVLGVDIRVRAENEAKEIVARAEKEAEAARQRVFSETRAELGELVLRAAEKVLERSVREEDDKRLAKSALEQLK